MTCTKGLVKVCGPDKDEQNLQIAIKKHTLGWECGLGGEHLDSTGKILGSRILNPRKRNKTHPLGLHQGMVTESIRVY